MKFFTRNSIRPSQFVLIGDQALIVLGLVSALLVNYRLLSIREFPLQTIFYRILIHLSLGILAWSVFKIYKKVIRFFNSKDYLNLIGIIFLIHVLSASAKFVLPQKFQLKPELFLISFFITSIYIIGSRFIISYLYFYYNRSKKSGDQKRLLIYGAGELGVFLKKSISTHYENEFNLLAFLDDDKNKIGRYIGGVKVLDASKELKDFVLKNEVTDIIIANKMLSPARKAQFLEDTLPFKVRIREISSIQSLFSAKFNLDKLASIDINDLMNRDPIQLYDEHVAESLKGKTIMVTGAAGSIGSEIVRKLSEHDASLIICVDFSESALYDLQQELKRKHSGIDYRFVLTDIRDEQMMTNLFEEFHPHIIYHAAAYKHVPLMEEFPWQAVQTNVIATWKIVQMAVQYKVEKFVFISSDKAVNPTSVMGATKRLAEIIVQSFSSTLNDTCFVVTRFGNVLGSNGSVVPLFKKQIQNGGPVTVTHPDMIRYFMTIAEACQLVLEASVMAEGGEVFVFDMGEPVKIVDLARNMIRLAGYTPDVDMKIQFIGERPGEKLYEDLFSDSEEMKETHHEKIMISKENVHSISEAENIIAKLQALENFYEPELFKVVIKDLLPEYQSVVSGEKKVVNFRSGNRINQYNYQN
ncbi:MAG TPA: nucleoside-diphosphate sugar epimerase/dehydratase [Ferruginibacter sp.]|nr:nucleoside-diphosphate sugar epimerase/dehydratase [Ferruginibacter sp.]